MKTKLTKILAAIIALAAIVAPIIATAPTYADGTSDICGSSVDDAVKAAYGCGESSGTDLTTVIQNILNAIISVAGLVAVVFVIIGGINYITSAGDAGKVKQARNTILNATIGIIIVALAFAIVNFTIGIINRSSSSDDESDGENATSFITEQTA